MTIRPGALKPVQVGAGEPNGIAGLDGTGKVPTGSLPPLGGETLTEVVASSAQYGYTTVTHPAVALTSGAIRFAVLAPIPPSLSSAYPTSFAATENLATVPVNWSGGSSGSFDADPGSRVGEGCYVYVGGSFQSINTYTNYSNVILNSSLSSGAATIVGIRYDTGTVRATAQNNGYVNTPVLNGPTDGAWAYSNSMLAGPQTIGTVYVQCYQPSPGPALARVAISLDGGTTFLAYTTTTSWASIGAATYIKSAGCIPPLGTPGNWKGADGSTIDWSGLATLMTAAGSGLDTRIGWAIGGNGANWSNVYIGSQTMSYGGDSTVTLAGCGLGSGSDYTVTRLSTTQAKFTRNAYGSAYSNVRFQVWTS